MTFWVMVTLQRKCWSNFTPSRDPTHWRWLLSLWHSNPTSTYPQTNHNKQLKGKGLRRVPPTLGLFLEGRTFGWASRRGPGSLWEFPWVPQRCCLRTALLWLRSADRLPGSLGVSSGTWPGTSCQQLSAPGLCASSPLSNKSESALTFKTKGHVNKKEWIPSCWEQVSDKAVSLWQNRDKTGRETETQWTQRHDSTSAQIHTSHSELKPSLPKLLVTNHLSIWWGQNIWRMLLNS